mgnify:CR=1 FL=1
MLFRSEDPECYHMTCDTPEHLDYPHMARIAERVTRTLEALADGDAALVAARAEGCVPPTE